MGPERSVLDACYRHWQKRRKETRAKTDGRRRRAAKALPIAYISIGKALRADLDYSRMIETGRDQTKPNQSYI